MISFSVPIYALRCVLLGVETLPRTRSRGLPLNARSPAFSATATPCSSVPWGATPCSAHATPCSALGDLDGQPRIPGEADGVRFRGFRRAEGPTTEPGEDVDMGSLLSLQSTATLPLKDGGR